MTKAKAAELSAKEEELKGAKEQVALLQEEKQVGRKVWNVMRRSTQT